MSRQIEILLETISSQLDSMVEIMENVEEQLIKINKNSKFVPDIKEEIGKFIKGFSYKENDID